jgi:hypothetical protein
MENKTGGGYRAFSPIRNESHDRARPELHSVIARPLLTEAGIRIVSVRFRLNLEICNALAAYGSREIPHSPLLDRIGMTAKNGLGAIWLQSDRNMHERSSAVRVLPD